jgi:hypothetical protein
MVGPGWLWHRGCIVAELQPPEVGIVIFRGLRCAATEFAGEGGACSGRWSWSA